MGNLGPMSGQNNHFSNYAVDKLQYAMDRYRNEVNRLYGVLNRRLEGRDYVAGAYSIADMPTYASAVGQMPNVRKKLGPKLGPTPAIDRWIAAIGARPAVARGMAVPS